jgi:hypothetical protein
VSGRAGLAAAVTGSPEQPEAVDPRMVAVRPGEGNRVVAHGLEVHKLLAVEVGSFIGALYGGEGRAHHDAAAWLKYGCGLLPRCHRAGQGDPGSLPAAVATYSSPELLQWPANTGWDAAVGRWRKLDHFRQVP